MWANAQCDGGPAEHRWHTPFDAAKTITIFYNTSLKLHVCDGAN